MDVVVEEVPFEVVRPFAGRASRERVAVKPTPDTRWFVARSGGVVLALAGLYVKHGRARLKGAWTVPEMRGRGLGRVLIERRIQAARDLGMSGVEVFSLEPAWFLRNGWRQVGVRANAVPVLFLAL